MDWPVGMRRQPRMLELGLIPPLVANDLTLEGYAQGGGVMIGDVVTVRRRLLPSTTGVVAGLRKADDPVRKWGDRLRITGVAVWTGRRIRYYRPARIRLARRPTEYRGYWQAWYEEHIGFWKDRAADDPLYPNDQADAPEPRALSIVDLQFSFRDGLDIAFSGLDDGLAEACFRRTIIQADHLLATLHTDPLPQDAEHATRQRRENELEIRRKRAYSAALLGEPFDPDGLRQSALHWADDCADVPSGYWDDQHKLKLLRAVAWAMIAGDLDHARELLASKRSFSHHEDHRGLLREMARKTAPPHADRAFVGHCRTFFDFLRHPGVADVRETSYPRETAFEFGALMSMFIDRPGEEIDWRAVVDAVSR